jgi:hypothetical protein
MTSISARAGVCRVMIRRGQLAEAPCVAHLVCARKWAHDVESLAFEQAPGSGVLVIGDRGNPADPRHRRQAPDQAVTAAVNAPGPGPVLFRVACAAAGHGVARA